MGKKERLRNFRPGAAWRQIDRAKLETQQPYNSPRMAKSKEAKQSNASHLHAPTKDQESGSGPAQA